MKKNILFFVSLGVLLFASSCKKCITCKNKCYKCGGSNTAVFCSNDYANPHSWSSTEEYLIATGCVEIDPTEELKICDDNVENFKDFYEKSNYFCTNK